MQSKTFVESKLSGRWWKCCLSGWRRDPFEEAGTWVKIIDEASCSIRIVRFKNISKLKFHSWLIKSLLDFNEYFSFVSILHISNHVLLLFTSSSSYFKKVSHTLWSNDVCTYISAPSTPNPCCKLFASKALTWKQPQMYVNPNDGLRKAGARHERNINFHFSIPHMALYAPRFFYEYSGMNLHTIRRVCL